MALSYLTVQDLVFLNLRLTKSPQAFDCERLEEAVFYQYAPGGSADLAKQGARFLTGFAKMRPFASGNEACAFAGLVVFLEANGRSLRLVDGEAALWVGSCLNDRALAEEAIRERMLDAHAHLSYGVPNFEDITDSVVERYAGTLAQLSENQVLAQP